jgi:hypothetical protein
MRLFCGLRLREKEGEKKLNPAISLARLDIKAPKSKSL